MMLATTGDFAFSNNVSECTTQARTRSKKANKAVDSAAVPSVSSVPSNQSSVVAGPTNHEIKRARLGSQLDWAHAFR